MKYLNTDTGELIELEWKTPYNHDTQAEAFRCGTVNDEDSMTDQSFKDDADINQIIQRVMKGEEVPPVLPEHFGKDERVTLLEARTRIAESNATFYELPPHVRAQFLNDPSRWEQSVYQALSAGNLNHLRQMGLDIPEPVTEPRIAPEPEPAKETDKVKS